MTGDGDKPRLSTPEIEQILRTVASTPSRRPGPGAPYSSPCERRPIIGWQESRTRSGAATMCPSASPPPGVSAHTGTQAGQTPPDEQARNPSMVPAELTSLVDRKVGAGDAETVLAAWEESGLSLSKFADSRE